MEHRRDVLRMLIAGAAALGSGCERSGATRAARKDSPMTKANQADTTPAKRMPVLFVGHGSPMNVIEDNAWSRGFAALGRNLPKPRAILAISAHWFVDGTYLTADASPRTIHDFSGFPRALYEVEYRAPGEVDLAARVRMLIGEKRAALSSEWGLDHGTWSVLRWMFPEADVPVVQLSIDRRLDPAAHHALASSLTELRDDGVLVFGSGNIVHNLRHAFGAMQTGSTQTPEWASRFDHAAKAALVQHDTQRLLSLSATDDGRLAHPTPDHWLPLLYARATTDERDAVQFPIEGFDLGSISMRSVLFG